MTVGPNADASGVIQQLQDMEGMHIQVTPVSMTLAANDAIHAANPSLSSDQLAGMPTDSGLPYEVNGMLNNLYHQIFSAETVEHLLDQLAPDAAAEFETAVGEKAGSYTVPRGRFAPGRSRHRRAWQRPCGGVGARRGR